MIKLMYSAWLYSYATGVEMYFISMPVVLVHLEINHMIIQKFGSSRHTEQLYVINSSPFLKICDSNCKLKIRLLITNKAMILDVQKCRYL